MVYTFSDDFEDGDLAGWSNLTAVVTNTTAAAHTGTRGMRQAPNGTTAGVASLPDATLPDGNTYADVSFWSRQVAHTSGNSPVVTIQNRTGVDHADLYVNYGADSHIWWDLVGTDHAETADAVVLGEWHFWRLVVFYGATTWTLRVWLDGVEQPQVTSTGKTVSDVRAIHFGGFATDPNTRDFDDISVLLTTVNPVAVSGAAALSGSGTLSPAGMVRERASAPLTASGTLGAGSLVHVRAAASPSGSGTLTAAGRVRERASATLAATATATATAAVRERATAALAASGSLTAIGVRRVPAAAALTATSTLSVSLGAITGTAALSATGAMAAAGRARVPAAALLSAASAFTGQARVRTAASAALSATASLTVAQPAGSARGVLAPLDRPAPDLLGAARTGPATRGAARTGSAVIDRPRTTGTVRGGG